MAHNKYTDLCHVYLTLSVCMQSYEIQLRDAVKSRYNSRFVDI